MFNNRLYERKEQILELKDKYLELIEWDKNINKKKWKKKIGNTLRVYWDDPEGWYGEWGGRGVQDWEHVYTRGGFMLIYGKTNTVL